MKVLRSWTKIKLRKSRKWNLEKIESRKVEKVGNNEILESRISEIWETWTIVEP